MTVITESELVALKLDIATIDDVVESNDDTTVTKDGKTIRTLNGRLAELGYKPPVAYAGGLVFSDSDNTKTIERSGFIYGPLTSELPFTTSGTWVGDDENKFYLIPSATGTAAGTIPVNGGAASFTNVTFTDVFGVTIENNDAAIFTLYESGGTSGYNKTTIEQTVDQLIFRTRNSANANAGLDYVMTKGASGATDHSWRVSNTEKLSLDSTGLNVVDDLEVQGSYFTLGGNPLGAEEITIADDAVGVITPPRLGGFAVITCHGDTVAPSKIHSTAIYFDAGVSLDIGYSTPTSTGVGTSTNLFTTDLVSTPGPDGASNVSVQSGVLQIENRIGAARTYQVTFL